MLYIYQATTEDLRIGHSLSWISLWIWGPSYSVIISAIYSKGVLFLDPEALALLWWLEMYYTAVPFAARSVDKSSYSEWNSQIMCWQLQIIWSKSSIIYISPTRLRTYGGAEREEKQNLRSPKVLPSAWSCTHGWLGEHVTGLFLFCARLRNP